MIWSKKTPDAEGWYWIKFKDKNKKIVKRPAALYHFKDAGSMLVSAFNSSWARGPNHGGPDWHWGGEVDKSIRFGPKIEEPS